MKKLKELKSRFDKHLEKSIEFDLKYIISVIFLLIITLIFIANDSFYAILTYILAIVILFFYFYR